MQLGHGSLRETNLDLVVLAYGHGADVVFLPQLLGQWGRRDLPAHVRGGIEVAFAVFAAVRRNEGVELHVDRLQREAWEEGDGCSVGYQGLLSIQDTPPHRCTRAPRAEVASEEGG